ncbi:hypothetical protein EDB89DRAFT_1974102 [Lactarius sanguifluus]|nr:hypothetical protein EDB89DRAFT_1974102 [Lactarius sanguifluus]
MVVVVPDTDEKMPVDEALQVEERLSLDTENPPPYAPPQDSSQGPSLQVATLPRSGHPPDLPPTNYLHVKEKNSAIKTKILLDLSMPPPQASALPTGIHDPDMSHLILDSHNGAVSGEVWVHRSNLRDTSSGRNKDKRERARLEFRSHNGAIKALVHIHPSMAEPRPFLQIEAKGHNGSVTISIPRSFRGQLMLHTDNGRVVLSPALAPRASMLSRLNGSHAYFVGERPDGDKWRTGTSGEGEEVDEVIGWSKNGSVKVSYDDEDLAGAGVLSSFFRAMGF